MCMSGKLVTGACKEYNKPESWAEEMVLKITENWERVRASDKSAARKAWSSKSTTTSKDTSKMHSMAWQGQRPPEVCGNLRNKSEESGIKIKRQRWESMPGIASLCIHIALQMFYNFWFSSILFVSKWVCNVKWKQMCLLVAYSRSLD